MRGAVFAWLKDGRLLVEGPANAPRLLDPKTGAIRPVTVPSFGDQLPSGFTLSHDERAAYFNLGRNESDVWLVEL